MSRRASVTRRSSPRWYASRWNLVARAVVLAFAISLAAAVIAVVVVPRLTGGSSLTVLTGSMVPTFSPGDVVVVRGTSSEAVCRDVSVGTVVTYLPEQGKSELITHRVVGKVIGDFPDGTDCRVITQGDANSAADEPVSPHQIRGVFMFGVPKLGWARQWIGGHLEIVGAALGVGLLAWWLMAGRRTSSHLISGFQLQQPTANPEPMPVADRSQTARDRALYVRELDLKERELLLRERELNLLGGPHE